MGRLESLIRSSRDWGPGQIVVDLDCVEFVGPTDRFVDVIRITFRQEGVRSQMVDWEPTAAALPRRLDRDVAAHPSDPGLRDLFDEIHSYRAVGDLPRSESTGSGDPLVPVTYRVDDAEMSLFTTISTIGDAHDLTLAELRLETFWPVDQSSATAWRRLMG